MALRTILCDYTDFSIASNVNTTQLASIASEAADVAVWKTRQPKISTLVVLKLH